MSQPHQPHETTPHATTWHGQPALALESDRLRVITVPGMGAKIVSIRHKTRDHEWLLGPADRPFGPVAYGASFVDQDMSGWDEMYPTIEACPYPADGPFAGAALPDHGEVWTLPWEIVEASREKLVLAVEGRALPYRLTRTMTLPDARTLQLDYQVKNTGEAPLAGLWTAHPQFAVTPATEIRLPDAIDELLAVQPMAGWVTPGMTLPWPVTEAPDGQAVQLDRVRSAAAKQSRKFYVLPDKRASWAMLVETEGDHWLRLDWDPQQVPYLGIWVDEGHYNPAPTVALEPSTGFYDSLARAWADRQTPVVAPGESATWSLRVSVGEGR